MKITVAAIQMSCTDDVSENIARADALVREASEKGADVVLLPELFEASRYVLLKLSPMADITMACKRLGTHVKEVHVVAAGGECKELLFLLDREAGLALAKETGAQVLWIYPDGSSGSTEGFPTLS